MSVIAVTLIDRYDGIGAFTEHLDGKLVAAVVALVLVGGVLVVADPFGGQERSQDDLEPLRIGHVPSPITSPHYTAIEEGFYREAGFDAEMVQLPGPEIGKALLNDRLEVGSSGTPPAAYQRAADLPIKLVAARAGYSAEDDGAYLMARNGSGIQEPEDIRGKTVCVSSSGSMGDLWIRIWADRHNMTINEDFELTYLGDTTRFESAFAAGEVDACYLGGTTPVDAMLAREDLAYRFDHMQNSTWLAAFVAVRQSWVEDKPEKLERFLTAYKKAAEYARQHPEEQIENIAAHTRFSEEVLRASEMPRVPANLTISVDKLNAVQRRMAEYGLVEQQQEMSPLVHNEAIMQVQQELRGDG